MPGISESPLPGRPDDALRRHLRAERAVRRQGHRRGGHEPGGRGLCQRHLQRHRHPLLRAADHAGEDPGRAEGRSRAAVARNEHYASASRRHGSELVLLRVSIDCSREGPMNEMTNSHILVHQFRLPGAGLPAGGGRAAGAVWQARQDPGRRHGSARADEDGARGARGRDQHRQDPRAGPHRASRTGTCTSARARRSARSRRDAARSGALPGAGRSVRRLQHDPGADDGHGRRQPGQRLARLRLGARP